MKKIQKLVNEKSKAIFIWLVIAFAAYLALIAVLIYAFPASTGNPIVRGTLNAFPYPAAVSGGQVISIDKLLELTSSVKSFYENQDFSSMGLRVDFNSPEGQKRLQIKQANILTKLIEDSIVETQARKMGIKLTDELIEQELDRKLKEYGSKDGLKDTLHKLYGWSIEDFKENIVKPDIYRQSLFENIRKNDPAYEVAKKKIEEAKAALKNSSFSEVAGKYSDGESAKSGGELGWFTYDQMLPEVAVVAFEAQRNKPSDIIESTIGFHIIQVSDKKNENGTDMVKISQIFVRTKSFSDWLKEEESKARIVIFANGYRWNKDENKIEFTDEAMRKYEEDLINNAYYDASVLF